jgi:FkbM family methyltransferase
VETAEELYILHEIFVERVYGYSFSRPTVYLDVGANVGFASLFFATLPNAVSVLGFEPFPQTHAAALANVALNPAVAERIHLENRAVLESAKKCRWNYAPDLRGSVGGFDTTPSEAVAATMEIDAVDAAEIVSSAVRNHPDAEIVLKLDCEGSEYAVIERLSETGWLSSLAAVLMEWHVATPDHHPNHLQKPLNDAGLRTIRTGSVQAQVGMIYAFQSERAP